MGTSINLPQAPLRHKVRIGAVKIAAILPVFPLLMFLACACAAPRTMAAEEAPEPSQLHAEILAATADLMQRMGANDLAGVAALYADDAVLFGPSGSTAAGREAIDDYWLGFGSGVAWELRTLSIEGRDRIAVQRGISVLTYERDGKERTSTVDFWLTWRKSPDGWRVAVDAYW